MKKLDLVFAVSAVLLFSIPCFAQQAPSKSDSMAKPAPMAKSAMAPPAMPKMIMVTPADLKYGPLPAWAVSGKPSVENTGTIEVAVLAGNPSKPGLYTVRVHCGDGYKIAPHWHPTAENVTVVQGGLSVGMGAKWDSDSLKMLPTGSFVSAPPAVRHFAQCDGDTVLQIYGQGPLKLNFVSESAAHPMKKMPAKAPAQ
jgi:quercetin dioxygenase-like cupin family protein